MVRGQTPVPDVVRFLNWLQCLRTGRQPVPPIEAGHQHSVACAMAVKANDSGRRMIYDTEKQEIHAG